MLVLTRKLNQSIRIGESITINVVRVRGNTVQLGIQAPKDVHILRAELLNKKIAIESKGEVVAEELPVEAGKADASEDDDTAFNTLDVDLSLYAPEEYGAEEVKEDRDACEFDSYLQQYMFAP